MVHLTCIGCKDQVFISATFQSPSSLWTCYVGPNEGKFVLQKEFSCRFLHQNSYRSIGNNGLRQVNFKDVHFQDLHFSAVIFLQAWNDQKFIESVCFLLYLTSQMTPWASIQSILATEMCLILNLHGWNWSWGQWMYVTLRLHSQVTRSPR